MYVIYIKIEVKERVLKKVASVCKRSTVLFSRLDATLTKTREAVARTASLSRGASKRVAGDEGPILRVKNCQNFGHRPERRGDDVTSTITSVVA